MNYVQLGKEISYVLRHHPEKYNLDIDNEGWVDVGDLLNALESRFGLLKEEDIVALMQQSEKERYELKNHRIRAYYGHSFSKKIMKSQKKTYTSLLQSYITVNQGKRCSICCVISI